MKKILFTIALAFMAAGAMAEDEYRLYVEATEGTTDSWSLSELKKMTFQNKNVLFTLKNGTTATAPISDIRRMFFSTEEKQGIGGVKGGDSFSWDGAVLTTKGAQGTPVAVYSPSGMLVQKSSLDHSGTVSLEQLQKGMYIISINGQNHKVFKR